MENEGMQYTFCISCGLSQDWGKKRTRGLVCKRCGNEDLIEIDKEEWEKAFDTDFERKLPLDIDEEV